MKQRFLGLISGTSRDGIDVVIADFLDNDVQLLGADSVAYTPSVTDALQHLIEHPEQQSLTRVGQLHAAIGEQFAEAAISTLAKFTVDRTSVEAIGSHGQTVWHAPDGELGFSMQIGDPARIAIRTGITTVADFRSSDIAAGGQGAPLVPPFHQWVFRKPRQRRAIVNIGGIANVTIVDDAADAVYGYDTGPGNGLMNAWTQKHKQQAFDRDGRWAASARMNPALLASMLEDPYFKRVGPRSTGFEYFNREWVEKFPTSDAGEVQATLLALTVETIASRILDEDVSDVLICGGGARNIELMRCLAARLGDIPVLSTSEIGLHADHVEATAFAWLARERLANRPGNLPAVTGARRSVVLGGIYSP